MTAVNLYALMSPLPARVLPAASAVHLHATQVLRAAVPGLAGSGRIAGPVQIYTPPTNTTSIPRRVRLHCQRDGRVAGEQWSDGAGNYDFRWVNERERYYVVGFDHTGTYEGVIDDDITPDLMP